MKTFIVSLGLIIFGVSGICFNWDLDSYIILNTHLKALCESSAAFCATCFDESEYVSNNEITYDENYVKDSLIYFIRRASFNMPCFKNGDITIDSLKCDEENDRVELCLKYTSDQDLFRIRGININTVTHSSCYEWISYDKSEH